MNLETWIRFALILVFMVVSWLITFVIRFVAIGQFLWMLFTSEKNDKLLNAGSLLTAYLLQVSDYLTFNSEEKPYPFGEFPEPREVLSEHDFD